MGIRTIFRIPNSIHTSHANCRQTAVSNNASIFKHVKIGSQSYLYKIWCCRSNWIGCSKCSVHLCVSCRLLSLFAVNDKLLHRLLHYFCVIVSDCYYLTTLRAHWWTKVASFHICTKHCVDFQANPKSTSLHAISNKHFYCNTLLREKNSEIFFHLSIELQLQSCFNK